LATPPNTNEQTVLYTIVGTFDKRKSVPWNQA